MARAAYIICRRFKPQGADMSSHMTPLGSPKAVRYMQAAALAVGLIVLGTAALQYFLFHFFLTFAHLFVYLLYAHVWEPGYL